MFANVARQQVAAVSSYGVLAVGLYYSHSHGGWGNMVAIPGSLLLGNCAAQLNEQLLTDST